MKTLAAPVATTLLAIVIGGCSDEPKHAPPARPNALASAPAAETTVNPRLLRRFQPLAAAQEVPAARIELGKKLFFDKRLSLASDVSCNSCHDVAAFGMDKRARSTGTRGQIGERNAPTVMNAFGHVAQFWDGRASTIEEQAKGPITNPREMGMPSGDHVVSRLRAVPGYAPLFRDAFPGIDEPITFDHVAIAIGAYERQLVTPSRWDRYLAGDKRALEPAEIKGLRTFLNIGCVVCHTGPLLGAASFERVGVVEAWPNRDDVGRMKITSVPADRMVFKVPSLRNVAETGPYFHDGSAATLPQAVSMMARHQLGLELSDDENASIVTWLGSLTGTVAPALVAPPSLP